MLTLHDFELDWSARNPLDCSLFCIYVLCCGVHTWMGSVWWPWGLNALQLKKTHANSQNTKQIKKTSLSVWQHLKTRCNTTENSRQVCTCFSSSSILYGGWWTATSLCRCAHHFYVPPGNTDLPEFAAHLQLVFCLSLQYVELKLMKMFS